MRLFGTRHFATRYFATRFLHGVTTTVVTPPPPVVTPPLITTGNPPPVWPARTGPAGGWGTKGYVAGDWAAICDQCGLPKKASELRLQYDGLRTCGRCWDYRHPQELKRPVVDPKPIPWSRPVPPPLIVGSPPEARFIDGFMSGERSVG